MWWPRQSALVLPAAAAIFTALAATAIWLAVSLIGSWELAARAHGHLRRGELEQAAESFEALHARAVDGVLSLGLAEDLRRARDFSVAGHAMHEIVDGLRSLLAQAERPRPDEPTTIVSQQSDAPLLGLAWLFHPETLRVYEINLPWRKSAATSI